MATRGTVKQAKKPAARSSRHVTHQRSRRSKSLIDDVTKVHAPSLSRQH
jgi:hypothetical protein